MKYKTMRKILELMGFKIEDGEKEFPEGIKYFSKLCMIKGCEPYQAVIQITLSAVDDKYYEVNAPEIDDDALMEVNHIEVLDADMFYSIALMELLINTIRAIDGELRDFNIPRCKSDYNEYYCGHTYTKEQAEREKLS